MHKNVQLMFILQFFFFFFQAEDGIRDHAQSRGLGDVYKRQLVLKRATNQQVELSNPELLAKQLLEQIEVQYASQLNELMTYNKVKTIQDNATKYQNFIESQGQSTSSEARNFLDPKSTSILKLSNLIDCDQIEDDKFYSEVFDDLQSELEKIGKVIQIVIPRIKEGFEPESIGNVFVVYENQKLAQIAKLCLKIRNLVEMMLLQNIMIQISFLTSYLFEKC
eukprot:TRINITY_DN11557_c0_g1_i4.p1 TRINITY_DN11557_c0_g1~~TRINITY_DN11557_c0_g1_i4.p1  ORF type:complete len:222 (-),score=42.90 TRINITY_DN11557_c0_g1_i4:160-825(-)